MERRTKLIAAVSAVAVAGAAALGVAAATDDDDRPLEGETLEKATAAALEATGGGEVVETEIGDDGAAYGVEVRLDDGRVFEVNLNDDFEVIGQERDEDVPGEEDD